MKTVLTLIAMAIISAAAGQTKIQGVVKDGKGSPVAMANVVLANTYDGTTSDFNGAFEFITAEKGTQTLMVKFVGYKDFTATIILDGTPQMLNITLWEQINELKAVTISAGAFTASDESRRTVFRAVDIATTAGATADIAGALNTLPGTQKVGESGRLFVRGGDGSEAKTFIDGLMVLDAYSPSAPNTPSRGRFLPFMFKGTSFSTGGYSAEYGQALSSALVLDSRDKTETTRTDIGILSVGGDVAHTQAWNTGSLAGKVQYTNITPYFGLINQEIDWQKAPVSTEGNVAFRQEVGNHGMLKVFSNFNNSNFSLYNHSVDNYDEKQQVDLTNQYRYLNTFYKDALSDRWVVRGGLSYTAIKNIVNVDGQLSVNREDGSHAKIVFDGSLNENVELKTGIEILSRNYSYDVETVGTKAFQESITSGFAEMDLYASNAFVTRIGSRVEYNGLQDKTSVDPRLSLAYRTGASGQVSLAYGIFRQSVKNEWLREQQGLSSEKAQHYILNYQRIEDNKTFRIEGYYKTYSDLVKSTDENQLNNTGFGFARGIELFWRDSKTVKHADYWISYSFLDTKRNYLNFKESAIPTFASKHNFSAVLKYFVKDIKSQLGFTYSYSSGRTYHDPHEIKTNSGKTPAYQDLSFNWSYLPKPHLIVYLSCTNLTGHDNIFGYEFGNTMNDNGEYNRRAIRQPAPRFLFVGVFITLSKEKSVNQLPTL
jgi:hypothetical protein